MAMVLDSFVKRCTASLEDFAGQEACAALGIGDDVRSLLATLSRIGAIVSHEEQRKVLSAKVDAWVAQVKDAMYEVDDVLDICMIEGGKILTDAHTPTPKVRCSFMFSCFKHAGPRKFHHEIGFKIRNIDLRLREVEEEMPRLPAGSVHSDAKRDWFSNNICKQCYDTIKPHAVGAQVQKAVGSLVPRMLREGKKKVDVFAIVGAVGIGKTTLAREIYNDGRMTENFPICVWVKMSKDLSEVAFLKKIIRGAGANVGDTENKEELLGLLSSALSKRFLIVLDDLDNPGIWDNLLKDPLGDGVARGRILITTRNEEVATSMKAIVHLVDKMDTESGWALFCKQVLPECNSEELAALKDVGINIAEKCDGHPLAIKVVAGVLRSRGKSKAEWQMVLESDSWSMRPIIPEVPQALYVSYVDLPSELKECFLHCSLYPEECPIQHFDLVRHWIAEGIVNARDNKLLEESAEEYYVELISRNLLQPDPDNVEQCWITHDLLRSLARVLIAEESILINGQQKPSTSSLSKPRHLTLCNMENSLEDPISLKQKMSIRSLMLFKSPNVRSIDLLLEPAPCLRVLDLSKTAIESLPKSIGNLLYLRYLNLDGTQVRDIPSSIGFLINLQTLSLQGCQRLQRLPWSIRALLKLRCLCLEGTSLSYVPKGVGELKHLNYLSGLIIGHDNNGPEGCDLDDLKTLSELRHLHIESLDRATSGAAALANKPFLKDLYLSEQALVTEEQQHEEQENQENKDETGKEEKEEQEGSSGQCSGEESAKASEKIWNELTPPQSIEKLLIKNYKGVKFPNWMKGPKLGTSFPSLVFLDLDNCMSCTRLPSLGLLNQLQSLQISNADSVITIGPEFLGNTVLSPAISFPKLEVLKLRNMKKLEEWSLAVEESQVLLPCLKSLHIQSCHKLKALPEGLKHVALCDLRVEGAYNLTEIKDLPKLSDELHLKDNKALQRISNLRMLRSLIIDDCSKLKHVTGLDALQHLRLVFLPSTETFHFEELIIFWSITFPRWLELLIQKCKGLRRFELQCSLPLLRSCLDGGKNWHIVQQIPEVRIISCDGKRYIRYNKNRRIYHTNAQSEE
ncbi:putative disease resistance RPP13-like protein 1 [Phragmites australis]|uniref:putative disease resistance RPP13-like protein 1 n=1 Tax=Phragmites australis TaxID=29695 RepID=UPI002D7A3B5D|nr:putative disease resistance RPP13-like protein 1 [Phragmites australis]XP_062234008.1 putative disease resistance RPP13-like protein 1 [Phragmites australis]XP_062234009.1 putative disease resistance RPP13-like protein 1 [Phragmites australis]